MADQTKLTDEELRFVKKVNPKLYSQIIKARVNQLQYIRKYWKMRHKEILLARKEKYKLSHKREKATTKEERK